MFKPTENSNCEETSSVSIFIGGLPETYTHDEVLQKLVAVGEVLKLKLITDVKTNRLRRYGFLSTNEAELTKFLEARIVIRGFKIDL